MARVQSATSTLSCTVPPATVDTVTTVPTTLTGLNASAAWTITTETDLATAACPAAATQWVSVWTIPLRIYCFYWGKKRAASQLVPYSLYSALLLTGAVQFTIWDIGCHLGRRLTVSIGVRR